MLVEYFSFMLQIVRTDLQELADLDLGGAPYGYTPFCSDRKEMDGFRYGPTICSHNPDRLMVKLSTFGNNVKLGFVLVNIISES